MRTAKSVFGVVWALGPILYCWGLAYHFFDISGSSVEEVEAEGLGPTVLGLAVVGFDQPAITWRTQRPGHAATR